MCVCIVDMYFHTVSVSTADHWKNNLPLCKSGERRWSRACLLSVMSFNTVWGKPTWAGIPNPHFLWGDECLTLTGLGQNPRLVVLLPQQKSKHCHTYTNTTQEAWWISMFKEKHQNNNIQTNQTPPWYPSFAGKIKTQKISKLPGSRYRPSPSTRQSWRLQWPTWPPHQVVLYAPPDVWPQLEWRCHGSRNISWSILVEIVMKHLSLIHLITGDFQVLSMWILSPFHQPNLCNAWSYDGGQKTEEEVDGIEDLIRCTWRQGTHQKPKDFIIFFKLLLLHI